MIWRTKKISWSEHFECGFNRLIDFMIPLVYKSLMDAGNLHKTSPFLAGSSFRRANTASPPSELLSAIFVRIPKSIGHLSTCLLEQCVSTEWLSGNAAWCR